MLLNKCILLHPPVKIKSAAFAFELANPELGISGQLTWTRLLQGFKTSPIIFDEALNRDLGLFFSKYCEISLLQYVDDLLLATKNEEN